MIVQQAQVVLQGQIQGVHERRVGTSHIAQVIGPAAAVPGIGPGIAADEAVAPAVFHQPAAVLAFLHGFGQGRAVPLRAYADVDGPGRLML